MKELDEVNSKVKGILDAYDMMVADSELSGFLDKDAMKQSRIDQILNLAGDGWRIAITGIPIHKAHIVESRILWEAGDA